MDKRLFSCGVFIDLKKAFDTVDHKIILHKLDHYGFRGVINKWFSSYLDGRYLKGKIPLVVYPKAQPRPQTPRLSIITDLSICDWVFVRLFVT